MQVGTLVIAGLCGVVGLVAGRASAPVSPVIVQAAPLPAPVVVFRPTPVVVRGPEPTYDDGRDDDEGSDLGVVIANLQDQALMHPVGNAVAGRVIDPDSNEPAIGATVVATSPALVGEQVVVTDETGKFTISGLPAGYYTLTVYYNDTTSYRSDVALRDASPTDVDIRLDHIERGPVHDGPPIMDREQNEDGYIRQIPVGRTFEATLGAAAGSQEDALGVTFSGDTILENQDEVDAAPPLSAVISSVDRPAVKTGEAYEVFY